MLGFIYVCHCVRNLVCNSQFLMSSYLLFSDECIKRDCQYYFSVDSTVQITNTEILEVLIEQNRCVIIQVTNTRILEIFDSAEQVCNHSGRKHKNTGNLAEQVAEQTGSHLDP